jgi:hypothetical protein
VINLSYSFWSIIILFIYIYIEIFSLITNYSILKNTKNYLLNYSKKNVTNLNLKYIYNFYSFWIFILFIFFKVDFVNNYIISIILFYIGVIHLLKNYISNNINFLLFNIITFLLLFYYINNYIIFFLFIELYSILFYFFFITHNQSKNINILQYKNMLLLYLFNNFFSTILYLIGMYYIIYLYGTLNFTELNYLSKQPSLQIYFIVISFIIKLSLPGFHFLKIEVYKYLSFENIIVYSVVTLFLNYIFLITFFNQNLIYINLNNYKLFNLLVIMATLIFIQKLKLNNFHEFIAYSGFSTNILIIINYVI